MRNSDVDCTVKCPLFTQAFYNDQDNVYACDYTEWAYTLFAMVGCSIVLVPLLLIICAVCKRPHRGSVSSRGSNSQYQVVAEEDIGTNVVGTESYGTFSPGIKTNIISETSPLLSGASTSEPSTSSRASVTGLLDDVSLNMRNDLANHPPAPLPVTGLTSDPSVRPRMPTPSSSLNKSANNGLTKMDISQALIERLENVESQESPEKEEQNTPIGKLLDIESQSDDKLESVDKETAVLNEDCTVDAGYIVFEPNTSDSFVNISQVKDNPNDDDDDEHFYHQLEEPTNTNDSISKGDESCIENGDIHAPLDESTPRKRYPCDSQDVSADDQDTLVGSFEDDDSVLHLEESTENEADKKPLLVSHTPQKSATIDIPTVPYYVPLNYGKNIEEQTDVCERQAVLAESPGSDSVEILPPEAESKFLDSLSTMTSSYHTAAGSMEELPQNLSDTEIQDEQSERVEDDERRNRFQSRADFENLLMLNVQQFPVQDRNGIFLLRESVSLSDCKVLTMYAKVPTSDQVIYHFKINVMNDGRSYLVNGMRTLPNLQSLIEYLREERDLLPCTLTREIQWNHAASSVVT